MNGLGAVHISCVILWNIHSISPHYSWILCLWICILSKNFLYPPNQYSAFIVLSRHAQSSKNLRLPNIHSQMRSIKATLCLLVSEIILSVCPFTVCLVLCFSYFCAFYWWFSCLKWPPSLPVLSRARRLCYGLWRKHMYQIIFILAWAVVLWLWVQY